MNDLELRSLPFSWTNLESTILDFRYLNLYAHLSELKEIGPPSMELIIKLSKDPKIGDKILIKLLKSRGPSEVVCAGLNESFYRNVGMAAIETNRKDFLREIEIWYHNQEHLMNEDQLEAQ